MIECNCCESIFFISDLIKVEGSEAKIDNNCPKCNADWNIFGFKKIPKKTY